MFISRFLLRSTVCVEKAAERVITRNINSSSVAVLQLSQKKIQISEKQFPTSSITSQIRFIHSTNINFKQLSKTMENHQVVPDVIPVAPKLKIDVTYKSGVSANDGNELKPRQVKDQPDVKWTADPNGFYTLCMTDPDAPSRAEPTYREWHHWLVGNIPGNDLEKGDVLSAYVGSGPPKDTGLHRYVFLVYKQNGKLTFTENRLPNNNADGRGGFSIAKFAQKYELGNPVAGNFYQAEWDDYVPELYKQLGA